MCVCVIYDALGPPLMYIARLCPCSEHHWWTHASMSIQACLCKPVSQSVLSSVVGVLTGDTLLDCMHFLVPMGECASFRAW